MRLTKEVAYPDEYRSGIPMYAQKDLFVEEQGIVVLPEEFVEGGGEGGADRLVGAAAVLQPGGVVVILGLAEFLAEAEGCGDLQLHLGTVGRVPAPAFGLPENRHGEGILPYQFLDILLDAVFVAVLLFFKLLANLITEDKLHALVYNGLTAQDIPVIVNRDIDIRKYLFVRTPMEHRTGLLAPVGGFFL